MSDYASALEYSHLLGRRARIKPVHDYCEFLHGKTGVIHSVYFQLYLRFDTPAGRDASEQMEGIYLTPTAFELEGYTIEEKQSIRKCPKCGADTKTYHTSNGDGTATHRKLCTMMCNGWTPIVEWDTGIQKRR